MVHMHRQPADCKHHHNNDEHSDNLFLGNLVFWTCFVFQRRFVEPQFSNNYAVKDGDDGQGQDEGDDKYVKPKS